MNFVLSIEGFIFIALALIVLSVAAGRENDKMFAHESSS